MKGKRGGSSEEGKRKVCVCVCVSISVLCPWQQWTHTEDRDWRRTTPSTSSLHPGEERRRGVMKKSENAEDEAKVRQPCVSVKHHPSHTNTHAHAHTYTE